MTVRCAVLGTSAIGSSFCEAASHVPGLDAVAVLSRDQARAEEFAAGVPGMRAFSDRDALLADPAIDAVYIASPTTRHEVDVLEVLDAGKHVLVEKPIALSLEALDRMEARARERGLVLMEAARAVHDPAFGIIAEALPRLGRLWHARFEKCQYSSRYDAVRAGEHRRAFDPDFGHSALSDIGVYTVLPAIQLFGEPDASWSTSQRLALPDGRAFDGSGLMVLEYADSAVAGGPLSVACRYSKVTATGVPSVIEGEDAVLEIDAIAEPGRIVLRPRDGGAEVLLDRPQPSVAESMRHEIADFAALVEAGEAQHRFARISRGAVGVMERAYAR